VIAVIAAHCYRSPVHHDPGDHHGAHRDVRGRGGDRSFLANAAGSSACRRYSTNILTGLSLRRYEYVIFLLGRIPSGATRNDGMDREAAFYDMIA